MKPANLFVINSNVNTRIRKGYLGQITRLAVALEKLTEKDELIRKACEGAKKLPVMFSKTHQKSRR